VTIVFVTTTTALGLANLTPAQQLRAPKLVRRITQLLVGLTIYGLSMSMVIVAGLGQLPWDVLHFGLASRLPWTIGQIIIAVSGLVLLLWIPIRQLPGLGTIANAILVGLATDQFLELLSAPHSLLGQVFMMGAGITLNGLATAMYIGSQLGPGPRDGLMTGISRVSGLSLRLVRTAMEVVVVALGWLLGGIFGVGTIVYALAIGPLTQALLPWVVVRVGDEEGQVR
jgi:uncharacterized membrane protein YczE